MAVKPSLALIPSGVKASKVYSVLPADGVGDFDFSRSGSATRVNKDGLIETVDSNVPRLNYPLIEGEVSGCPSLLLEPQSTNLIAYSEDFSQSYWIKTGSSITSNSVISPDGTLNAFKISEDLSNGTHRFYKTALSDGAAANKEFTYSIFLKKAEIKWFLLKTVINSQSVTVDVWFDLENGVIGTESNGSGKIENYGNDWYRCSINIVTNASATSLNIYGYLAEGNNSYSYQGDGTSGLYIYGAMLEENDFSTSYIPTTTSTATRSAETCNNAGDANTFNDSEGVLYAEGSLINDDGTPNNITLGDNTFSNNRMMLLFSNGTANRISARFDSSGSDVTLNADGYDLTLNHKVVLKYKANDIAIWVDGFEIQSGDFSFSAPSLLNRIDFYNPFGGGQNNFYGNTKQLQYYNTALTDAELEKLTSYDSFRDMAIAGQYKTY